MTGSRKLFMRDISAIETWMKLTSDAAALFERRWTWLALRRVDAELATALHEQRELFNQECVTGQPAEIALHGEALCRGYAVVVRAMEAAEAPDDAYVIGRDPVSGFTVAIGNQRAAVDRALELHGSRVTWVTPDEVAAMMASPFISVAEVKRIFPGAEIIEFRKLDEEGT